MIRADDDGNRRGGKDVQVGARMDGTYPPAQGLGENGKQLALSCEDRGDPALGEAEDAQAGQLAGGFRRLHPRGVAGDAPGDDRPSVA